jgi:hypothetical protein
MFALMGIFIICGVIWNKKHGDKGSADKGDMVGFLMLAGLLMLIGYVAVYGEAENWWESPDITAAGILIPMIFFAFITRALITEQSVFWQRGRAADRLNRLPGN